MTYLASHEVRNVPKMQLLKTKRFGSVGKAIIPITQAPAIPIRYTSTFGIPKPAAELTFFCSNS